MSLVILVLGFILVGRAGVDEPFGAPTELALELDVDEKVRLRSICRRTTAKRSSRYFFDDASVRVILSGFSSYSLTQFSTVIISLSLTESLKHR
jgi:hypothetical protein